MELSVAILAAGKGKRMVSDLPKVLHQVGGRSMLAHVLDTAGALGAAHRVVVYGHRGEAVRMAFAAEPGVAWVEQAEQLGTGHAVAQCLPAVDPDGIVLVLYGDVPLIRTTTLEPLLASARKGYLGLLTAELADPTGYGRIVRDHLGQVERIVEEKDASAEQRRIHEVNTGILAAPASRLASWVRDLRNDNAQGEYYLTDVIEMAVQAGVGVEAHTVLDPEEVQGVNDRVQLAHLERVHQARVAASLMRQGVTLRDPARVDVRGRVSTGRDVIIDINVVLEGRVELGDGVVIGPNVVLRDAVVEAGAVIHASSVVEEAAVGPGAQVGPFARLRPGARLAAGAKVGNFVEIKKATVGPGAKVNHLSYVGDAEIGAEVNVGAGTITCNYDGANKYRTVLEDGAFIGSNTALVAPVRVGRGATVGAGSTLTRDVPPDTLAVARARQELVGGWQRPVKGKRKT